MFYEEKNYNSLEVRLEEKNLKVVRQQILLIKIVHIYERKRGGTVVIGIEWKK